MFFFRFCDVEKKEQLVVKREAEAEELTLLSNHSKDRTTTMTMMIPTIPPAESPSSGSLEDITLRDLFFYEAGTLAHSITSDQKFLIIPRFLRCFFIQYIMEPFRKGMHLRLLLRSSSCHRGIHITTAINTSSVAQSV